MNGQFRPRQESMGTPPSKQPALRLHRAVVAVLLVLFVVEIIPPLIFRDWDVWSAYVLAFIPARFGQNVQFPQAPGSAYWTMLTYSLVHGNFAHLFVNSLWLLVFGTPLARVVGTSRFLLIAMASSVGGALATLALHWGEFIVLVGASAAIAGMLGALVPLMFADGGGRNLRVETRSEKVSILPVSALLTDKRALGFMANVLILTVVTGAAQSLMPTTFSGEFKIAWESHLGGFLVGLVAIYVLAPRKGLRGG